MHGDCGLQQQYCAGNLKISEHPSFTGGTDVELLGFSGSDWYGYRTEKIAQVSQPTEEMARMAGQQLLEQIQQPKACARTTVLHSTYIPKKQIKEFSHV